VDAVQDILGGIDIVVPEYSQYIGAVGAAMLVSGLIDSDVDDSKRF
jgi:activator of 2-hydroxyglutaryl-CoA dehydratase